jgi:hypothetical protein
MVKRDSNASYDISPPIPLEWLAFGDDKVYYRRHYLSGNVMGGVQ